MTWSQWLRAIFTFDRIRHRQIDDLKISAYLTASLMKRKRMPTLHQWLNARGTRPVVGMERERLRAERRYIEDELKDVLQQRKKKKKAAHGHQRSTR